MALAIKAIPTICGKDAQKFENAAIKVENNPGTQDYRKKARAVKEYLQKIKL